MCAFGLEKEVGIEIVEQIWAVLNKHLACAVFYLTHLVLLGDFSAC